MAGELGNSARQTDEPATAQVDIQDPLPETNWLWRRIYVFVFSMVSVAFILFGLESLHGMGDSENVFRVTRYMIGIHAMLIMFYMVAPSAEQIVKLIQAARIIRSGVTVSKSATVETPQGARTEVSTSVGPTPDLNTAGQQPAPAEEADVAPRSRT